MEKKYDIAVLGVWSGCNYGSIATYYALNRVLKKMGNSVLMVDKPAIYKGDVELQMNHSRRFAMEHYDISPSYRLEELEKLNEYCDKFVIGSDQVWNYGISKNFGKSFYFDFVKPEKTKVAYASSFGHGIDFAPKEEVKTISSLMREMDAISVREEEGVKICKEVYGVEATQVLDPVFLADREIFDELADKSNINESEKYIATYILDPTAEKREALIHLSKKLGYKLINMLDGLPWMFKENKEKLDLDNIVENLQVEDWIYYIKNSEFVITDSCHGASFALLYNKNFISITNKRRGFSRFKSLADLFGFRERLVTDPARIMTDESLLKPIDYEKVNSILRKEKERCYEWLENALCMSAENKGQISQQNEILSKVKNVEVSQDFDRCRMLVTLLRDYGIRHVVLSAGSRNLNLVRLFEANKCFKTYSVIDERSAAFYAMGISIKLREPVAICCTSGTAASNYLSAITEAFYQHVPLVVITADRYPCLLGQNEDQTIPQVQMYGKVVKKSVTLPINSGYLGEWESRRLICEALLEMTHHGKGPVHINVPIASIERSKPHPNALKLEKNYRKIERITLEDAKEVWDKRVKRLCEMNRVMVLYGQTSPLSKEGEALIEHFAEKFKCVIITDHLSNYHGSHAVMSLPILREISQEYFDKYLAPDIVITIGGRRMLNDPSLPKLRAQKHPLGHWRVAEDGEVSDTYRKLSRIFECSSDYFFKYFVENSFVSTSDGSYFETWKKAEKEFVYSETKQFSQLYVVEHIVTNLPPFSSVHYGIGNTIMFANRFVIDPTVEVFCNMGTNGIDGSASTFMGQACVSNNLCFLIISDLSFFYDMNSVWSKKLTGNIRVLLCNNNGTDLLRHLQSPAITHKHNGVAREWVRSLGFTYFEADNKESFDEKIKRFLSDEDVPMFFEVFTSGR